MGSIVLTSYGTLGDHLPLVALGQALQISGKQVRVAFNEAMISHAEKAGLESCSNGLPPLGREQASRAASSWNHFQPTEIEKISTRKIIEKYYLPCMPYLINACSGADLIITSPQSFLPTFVVSQKLSIPCLCVTFSPLPFLGSEVTKSATSLEDDKATLKPLLDCVNLSDLSRGQLERFWPPPESLLAASPHFYQLSSDLSSRLKAIGFWFYEDPNWQNWLPDKQLRDFCATDPKPLVLTFSSLPLEDSKAVVEIHARAAAHLNRRLVIQQGWANLNLDDLPSDLNRDQMMSVGFIPQDWLFSQAAAVIHHGGIGTTARIMRNGCPMLVEPYGNDQFMNARQIVSLGIGAAMHPHLLSAEMLAQVLEQKVLTPSYKERAERLGALIRSEPSLDNACQYIESLL